MAMRTVRLDEEAERALERLRNFTGLSVCDSVDADAGGERSDGNAG